MFTICISTLKGGVGKTTTATTLAWLLANEYGKRVLLVDADCQGNASSVYGVYSPEYGGMAELMRCAMKGVSGNISNFIIESGYAVDLIPANGHLYEVNGEIMVDRKHNQTDILRDALAQIRDEYDFCIIDCGLVLDMTVLNSLISADMIISPITIGSFELDAYTKLENQLFDLRTHNPDVEIVSLITKYQRGKTMEFLEKKLRDMFLSSVFDAKIRNSITVSGKSFLGRPLPAYSKNGIATKDYRAVLEEILEVMADDRGI